MHKMRKYNEEKFAWLKLVKANKIILCKCDDKTTLKYSLKRKLLSSWMQDGIYIYYLLELATNLHEGLITKDMAPTKAFSWLKVHTCKTLLRHYAIRAGII